MTINSSFYGYISHLKWIKRWELMRNAHEENVIEHSWDVSVLANALAPDYSILTSTLTLITGGGLEGPINVPDTGGMASGWR
ncbi:YfbR-like 5'-deoxynucleotidase [Methylomarinum vadi]|uniref:YfbR-like 5'-deoxynucleotidase n=1 Tax=Methylomarinum vadi TaxID=438855 RepID=UPI0013640F96|nr:YfbR-like 5'-deoxynucleotidase [Methylomarinum vadi]